MNIDGNLDRLRHHAMAHGYPVTDRMELDVVGLNREQLTRYLGEQRREWERAQLPAQDRRRRKGVDL